jgi:translation elongation factor EF-G
MGEVQIEVSKQLILDRFGWDAEIDAGKIVYRETIASPVEGMGHFEPLRHYAEVHLLMEPLPAGSGIILESACSSDDLDLNWQRLIISSLASKQHKGVLTGAPLTDIKLTVVAGRAHLKHTEGGDFRQAACRAVRQGLMKAENVLLEPFYDFVLEVPSEQIGRAISDLKAMGCTFSAPQRRGQASSVTGCGPVSELNGYQTSLIAYTRGRGRISCHFAGYHPCHDAKKVVEESGYDPERDTDNPADSVFCSHGSGVSVKWDCAETFMHVDSGLRFSG